MAMIQLEVSDEVVKKFGIESLTQKLQQQLELERLKILTEEINEAIQTAGLDSNTLFEEARAKAWEEYKTKFLSHIWS
jgi:PleD family two-component response regulator